MNQYTVSRMTHQGTVVIGAHEAEYFSMHDDGTLQLDADGHCVAMYAPGEWSAVALVQTKDPAPVDPQVDQDMYDQIQEALERKERADETTQSGGMVSPYPLPGDVPLWS